MLIYGDLRFSWSDLRWFKDYIMLICSDLWFSGRPCGRGRFGGRSSSSSSSSSQ